MGIFSDNAPLYWAAGLSVIPLLPKQKKPFQPAWQQWHDHLPTIEQQQAWALAYPDHNIGLVLGRQSNVTMIDIDTDDETIINAILEALPATPWKRVGSKGFALAFKFSGIPTFRIDDNKQGRIIEYLSSRVQLVLPPSIHPDTLQPYVASCELLDVIDQLPTLPDNIEDIIRTKLSLVTTLVSKTSTTKFKIFDKVPVGARDTKMNQYSGLAAYGVMKGEITFLQAISNMRAWIDSNVEKVSGDNVDCDKGCMQIVQYILHDVNSKNKILPTGWDEGMTEDEKKAWGLSFNDDQEEWPLDKILDYISKSFMDNGPEDPKRHASMEFVLNKMAKSTNLTTMEEEIIFKHLKVGMNLNVSVFKRRINEIRKGPIEGLNHTEIANAAVKEMERIGYRIVFYNEQFWSWEGTHWAELEEDIIWKVIAYEFGDLPAARKASDHSGIIKIMSKIVPNHIKATEVEGVNFRNGFLTSDLRLVSHNPDFGMTYVMGFNYDASLTGKAVQFEQLLETCWGHNSDFQEKKKALQEAMAITLFNKGTTYQKAMLLHGVARCGKSQILEVVMNMVPAEAKASLPAEQWGETFSLSFLQNKVLNIVGEIDEKKRIPGKQFKELIDGTQVTAQYKFKNLFQFQPTATHWFAGNHLPKTKDVSEGFNRRWLILNFDRPVPTNKIIPDLGKKIVNEEIEAVVAWAISSYPELKARGYITIPSSSRLFGKEMAMQNSIIRQWMDKRLVQENGKEITEEVLYRDFFVFCSTQGITRGIERKDFSIELAMFMAEMRAEPPIVTSTDRIYKHYTLAGK